ncbi:hypothetical protein ILUMI_22878 [Ignelater luminosus]|uniref:Uncharacterized protein n=1 Tax=Ignelater luminosus TaxID=2038154 RepID=A0A8K0G2E3_IGNLU|nr:hypothetical protein ILUMI_22878 [Ignelater luminosus]
MGDIDIIESADCNSNTRSISDVNIIQYLNLGKIPGLAVNSVNSSNILFINKPTECIQYRIDCNFQLNLNVELTVIYPKLIPINKVQDPLKLRINVTNSKLKKEIISCTNYLQRQRNVDLAFSVLRRCAVLISERQLIFNMLLLHFEGFICSEFQEDGGIALTFEDKMSRFKFFEASWKILFNCKENHVIDFIDFNVATQDRVFYNAAKPLMMVLVEPNLSYPKKVELWSAIVSTANNAVQESHVARLLRNSDVELINSTQIEKYDISDSDDDNDDDDDDDCMVIDDEKTEEIILN